MLVAGSIDCADPNKTTAVITGEIRNLLTEAKGHSNHVHFSSVLPRSDGSIQLKIDTVNEAVKKVFREQPNCSFIDNDGTFKLSDLSQNEAMFLRDGHHISYRGTDKLISNLELNDLAFTERRSRRDNGSYFVQTYQPRPPFQVPPSSLYNPPMPPTGNAWRQRQNPGRGRVLYSSGSTTSRCAWCNKPDHDSSSCPVRGTRACFLCSSTAHKAVDCCV